MPSIAEHRNDIRGGRLLGRVVGLLSHAQNTAMCATVQVLLVMHQPHKTHRHRFPK